MTKSIVLACAMGFALSGCAANGRFASKTNPVDLTVSLNRVCTGVKGADLAARGILSGLVSAGKADPADLDLEAGFVTTISAFCDPTKPPTDLAGALAAVGVASVNAGDLIAKLSK